MAFDLTGMLGSSENQVQQIPVERLVPYYKHPFQLYQGERLQDMVDSIQKNGILVPLVVRPCMGDYEILVGHNRWNAAKLAGLSAVPAIVKSNLSEEEAEMYVIESNLMQATREAKPDIQRIVGLDTKRKVLKARIDEVQKQFALHHGAEI